MAKGGDKKRLEENKRVVNNFKTLIAIANAAFLIIRVIVQNKTVTPLLYAGFALTTIAYTFCYLGISSALDPLYNASGELVYAGADIKAGGVLSYYQDIIYISAFVQILGCYTDKAWYVFGAIPAYALYKLAMFFIGSWSTPQQLEIPESEADRKRREKKERQAARAEKFTRR